MNKIKENIIDLSLKKKWTLASSIIIFFSYAVICVVIYFSLYTWLIHHEEMSAVRTVDDLTSFLQSQDRSISIQDFKQNTGLIKSIVHQNQTVRIYNMDGYEVLTINHQLPESKIVSSFKELQNTVVTKDRLDGQDVIVVNRILGIGSFLGVLQLIHPLDSFQSMMGYVLTAMLIAGLGALLIAGTMSYYLTNLLMKPLKDLRDSMLSVKEQGFQKDISFTYNADDELGDLLKIYRSMMEELQIVFSKQQRFVSDASHELRTPIQALEGHLSLIKRWGKDDPVILEESLNTSIQEVNRMKRMIEELLKLARQEEREENIHCDVAKVLQVVSEELEVVYSNATINIEIFGEKRELRITENALSQILRNIIENGIRYNDREPIIDVQIHYLPDQVQITIQDNGIGIPKEHIPHLFDRFYRIDLSRQNSGGGTGLGLSIVKMLADKYDVEIDVLSTAGKGTSFTLLFS